MSKRRTSLKLRIEGLDDIETRLSALTVLIAQLVEGLAAMALDLSSLQSEVAENRSVVDSAIALLSTLADEIRAAAADPAAVQSLADELSAQTDTLAAAVAANTPGAGGAEEPAPEPTPVEPETPTEGGGGDVDPNTGQPTG